MRSAIFSTTKSSKINNYTQLNTKCISTAHLIFLRSATCGTTGLFKRQGIDVHCTVYMCLYGWPSYEWKLLDGGHSHIMVRTMHQVLTFWLLILGCSCAPKDLMFFAHITQNPSFLFFFKLSPEDPFFLPRPKFMEFFTQSQQICQNLRTVSIVLVERHNVYLNNSHFYDLVTQKDPIFLCGTSPKDPQFEDAGGRHMYVTLRGVVRVGLDESVQPRSKLRSTTFTRDQVSGKRIIS